MQETTITKKVRRYKRVADYEGADKNFRIFNIIFAFAISAACLAWGIYRIATTGLSDPELRWLAGLGIGVLAVLPLLLERIFKFNLSNFVWCMYLAFLLMAGFIGSALGLYPRLEHLYYDKIMHGIFGYVGSVGGLLLLCKLSDIHSAKAAFIGIICFVVSMASGAMWEIFEFTCDRLLNANAQGVKVLEGYTLVKDTMWDIVSNFIGAMVFVTHYIVHRATKKDWLIGSMIKDFTKS